MREDGIIKKNPKRGRNRKKEQRTNGDNRKQTARGQI